MANMSWNQLMLQVSNAISTLQQGAGAANGAAAGAQDAAAQAEKAAKTAKEAAQEAAQAAQRAEEAAALWEEDVSARLTVDATRQMEEKVVVETVETGEIDENGEPVKAKRFAFTIRGAEKGDKGDKGDTGESGVTFELRDGTKLYIRTALT